MTGQKRVSDGVGVMAHPDDSALLTYIGQPFPDKARSNVHRHLALCESCQLRYGELKHTTDLLTETLAHFEDLQYYPPLTEKVFQSIQNPATARPVRWQRHNGWSREALALGRVLLRHTLSELKAVALYPFAPVRFLLKSGQKKPRNLAVSSIPVVAIPAVLFLVLLAVFVVLASNSEKLKQFQPFEVTSTSVAQPTPNIVSHTAATPIAKPVISLCSTPGDRAQGDRAQGDRAQMLIRICGRNFTAGDQVRLLVYLAEGRQKPQNLVFVDATGSFQDSWVVADCKMAPLAIIAQDVTPGHTSDVSQVSQSIQFLNCSISTPNPTAESHGTH